MSKMEREDLMELEEEGGSEGSVPESSPDTLRILEALLFASDELLTAAKIKTILPNNPDARQIRKMIDSINVQLQKERHPFEIVEIGGGYQFRTVAYYHPWVRQIFKEKAAKKLSIQALECLAIIAYKQPVSKAEIEAIRGVVSDGAMKTLLEKKLVTITGRSEKPGRPLLYGTTSEFLKYFGLNKIEDLPRIEEFEAIAREKIQDLSIEELQTGESEELSEEEAEQTVESTVEQTPGASEQAPVPEGTTVFEIELPPEEEVASDKESVPEPEAVEEEVIQVQTTEEQIPEKEEEASEDLTPEELTPENTAPEEEKPEEEKNEPQEIASESQESSEDDEVEFEIGELPPASEAPSEEEKAQENVVEEESSEGGVEDETRSVPTQIVSEIKEKDSKPPVSIIETEEEALLEIDVPAGEKKLDIDIDEVEEEEKRGFFKRKKKKADPDDLEL
ncbi:MAG: SMC-Scp complex subunit ScpB [Fibrobacter sp.]|jgi:segregation and condensation protein B|nr:SMC-Scp complex subunit ScpB [Fibrobacter sp.]